MERYVVESVLPDGGTSRKEAADACEAYDLASDASAWEGAVAVRVLEEGRETHVLDCFETQEDAFDMYMRMTGRR